MELQKSDIFQRIRDAVKSIPKGKVATYGQIAKIVGTRDSRLVGWALRGNMDSKIPCHRVVKSMGYLAQNYSLGTWRGQKERLEKERIRFTEENKVDMSRHHWIQRIP
ncbi:MAG: MGMT family protein [Candidatus Wildermuthbacteria bacterium]|nr:MGMT family protein [Candidatus Wildermuthbacteria bacterium]